MEKHFLACGLLVALCFSTSLRAQNIADSLQLKEVVVTGTRDVSPSRALPTTVTVVEREQIEERSQPSLLPTVMQHVPGLVVTGRSMLGFGVSTGAAGGINLRGVSGGAGQLLVLIDGHPQYNGIYGHPIADSYQSLLAERVEVLRGPASVLYGSNAMGGVVNIITRAAGQDGVRTTTNIGAGSYGTLQMQTATQVKQGRFSSTVAAEYNRTDNHRPHMGFEQFGGFLKVGYGLSDHWKASLSGNLTGFNASYPGSTTDPVYGAEQWIRRGVVTAVAENRYDHTNGAVSVYSNFGWHKIDDGSKNDSTLTSRFFNSEDALTGVSVYQNMYLFKGNKITLGADYQHIYGHAYYTSKITGVELETANKQSGLSKRDEVAGYVDIRQDIASWLTLDAGIRADYHSVAGTEWVPQAGLVLRPMATGEVKLLSSKGFRNPTMRELYLYPPSNDSLVAERLWNHEISWHHRFCKVEYGLNLFYIKGDNMIQTVPVNGRPRNLNTGAIENKGIEVDATWSVSENWSLTTNHSWLDMKYIVLAAPSYKGFLGARFYCGGWRAALGLQYIGGLYTEVGANEQKENFCLLDASVSYTFKHGISLWLHGDNLLNQQYQYVLGYPMPGATFMCGVRWDS